MSALLFLSALQLVAFLQADLVHADIRDHAFRIDRQRLAVGQLVLHDETHRLRGDAQSPPHLGFVGADEPVSLRLNDGKRSWR